MPYKSGLTPIKTRQIQIYLRYGGGVHSPCPLPSDTVPGSFNIMKVSRHAHLCQRVMSRIKFLDFYAKPLMACGKHSFYANFMSELAENKCFRCMESCEFVVINPSSMGIEVVASIFVPVFLIVHRTAKIMSNTCPMTVLGNNLRICPPVNLSTL